MLVIELPKPHGTKFPRKIRFSEMWTITSVMSSSYEHCFELQDSFRFMAIEISVRDSFDSMNNVIRLKTNT
jgi:hypothetical protein